MSEQTFSVGKAPRVILTQVQGDVSVRAWQQQAVSIETDGHVVGLQQEGDMLLIDDCDSDIELQVPADTSIIIRNVMGDVEIEGVRRVGLENAAGDVELKDISSDAGLEKISDAIEITNLGGDLNVVNAPVLRVRHSVSSDAEIKNVELVEIETVGSDLEVTDAATVIVSTIGGDLSAENIAAILHCGVIGAGCQVQGSAGAEITIGNVGSDLEVSSAASLQVGNVGSDCELRDITGDVRVGYIGADASFKGVGGNLQVGSVGADAQLKGLQGSIEVGSIGGDLELLAAFAIDTHTRLNVGADASVILPDNANLSIRATVGGDISGRSIVTSRSGNTINLVYGDGSAHLELNVGGDLDIRSAESPRSSSSMSGSWSDFGREMSNLGREMGKLGQEISREIAATFNEASWSHGFDFASDIARRAEERARHAQRRAKEQTRRANERAARVNVRINNREWRLDPERLERIRDQARMATAEGVAGALEAVERAMSNLRVPAPPARPAPPPIPVSPAPPASPGEVPPMPPTSQDEVVQREQTQTVDLEQEREAILRMIAEGRITPEEGDLLLESLGS